MFSARSYILLINLLLVIPSLKCQTLSIEGTAQGTTYHMTYVDAAKRNLQEEIDSILVAFDYSVSTYQPNSIISKVNRNEAVTLDSTFLTCFYQAKKIWKVTDGAFDPTVYPLVNAWGFGPGKKVTIEKEIIDSILQFVGFEKMEIINGEIIKNDLRMGLDFNAFAQGYSVDVIASFLESQGINNYVVEIGGEVYAKGKQENGNPWVVGIERPIDNKTGNNPLLVGLKVDGVGVATSGDYRRFIIENGVKYAHHLDPKTGYPTKNNLLSVTVISPHAIISDATATGILVMGMKKAKKYLKKHPEIQIFLIYSDKSGELQFFETPKMKDYKVELGK